MPNGNHGESCKIHRNLTGILRTNTSSTKLSPSVMYSCASAQSAAPIHGAADEFKAELEVSRSRGAAGTPERPALVQHARSYSYEGRRASARPGARLEEVRRLAQDRLLSNAFSSSRRSSRSSRSSRRRGSGRRQRSSSSKLRKVIPKTVIVKIMIIFLWRASYCETGGRGGRGDDRRRACDARVPLGAGAPAMREFSL